MCKWEPGEPWWAFAWRQFCEKTLYVFAASGFITCYWFQHEFDKQKNDLIQIIKESHVYQGEQTRAMQELATLIKNQTQK